MVGVVRPETVLAVAVVTRFPARPVRVLEPVGSIEPLLAVRGVRDAEEEAVAANLSSKSRLSSSRISRPFLRMTR